LCLRAFASKSGIPVEGQDESMTTHLGSLSGWLRPKRSSAAAATGSDADAKTASTTGGASDREPVVVWEAANRMEAQIVVGRLESHGIPAIMQGEALGAIYGLTTGGLAATLVLVPAPLADKALDLLASTVDWGEPAEEEPEE
jgi:hypothetical protein